ncbi:hypothetical protein ACHAXT_002280 [Thalassiosira profunda]
MRPRLLMICLLRSSAARALATVGGRSGRASVGVGRNRAKSRLPIPRGGATAAVSTLQLDDDSYETSATSLHVASRSDVHASTAADSRDSSSPLLTSGHIAFRLARRTDVPHIQKCNLATLPENYNANFYVNHMRTWPELTLVAEHIPDGCDVREDDENTITPLRDYIRGRDQPKPKKEVVGYILGKVEERPINPQRQIHPPSRVPLYDDEETLMSYMNGNANGARFSPSVRERRQMPKEKIGHVTSLAVTSHARRLGIASSLLHQLHFHLRECYGADSVGLHVRISNKAAVRLYCDEGYDVADIIPLYYGDGEDAYFMRKDLTSATASEDVQREQFNRRQAQPQRQWRRGERERAEWLNRDAARGSFFENRPSLRDTLSTEERAWVNRGSGGPQISSVSRSTVTTSVAASPSLSGQFKRSFRTFFSPGEALQDRRQRNQFRVPVWEAGPEELRLPRYNRVFRREATAQPVVEDFVTERTGDVDDYDDIESYEEEELVMPSV